MKRFALVVAALGSFACTSGGGIHIPQVPPCIFAPQGCAPTDPKPEPTPTPTPVPRPTPTPKPEEPPAACSVPDAGSKRVEPAPAAEWTAVVNAVLVELTGGQPQGRTVLLEDQESFNLRVVAQLARHGVCAGVQTGSDQITIGGPERGQNYKVFTCGATCARGTVGWAPGSVRDTWIQGTPTPRPTPSPGPTPAPTPKPEDPPMTGGNCPALTFLKVDVKTNNPGSVVVDVTPQGPDHDRCVSIGKVQDKCPLGPEGPRPEDNAERIRCETAYGPYAFTLNGQDCDAEGVQCFHQGTNPLSVKVLARGIVQVTARVGISNRVTVEIP